MNVLRYCNLDESLQGEESLVIHNALDRLCQTKELDYMSYIVMRMFENTEVCHFGHKFITIFLSGGRCMNGLIYCKPLFVVLEN
jgi:hypothetical protein